MNDTFTNINDISLSSSRKKNFERLIAMLVANSDESVWSTAVDSIHEYYKRAKDDEFIKDLLTGYAADLNEKGDEEEELGKKIKVFVKICQLGIPKLNAFMESLLFTSPILPWQLEVIANTAKVYGSKMYMKGMLRSGLMFFVEQYLEQTKTPERGELLLYTMKQLVENLSEEHEGMFVTQTLDFLKKYIANKEGNLEVALLALALLSQFYEYNSPAENQYLGNIVENLIPFFIDDSEGTKKIFPALGQFLKVVLASHQTKVSVLSRQECASCIETVKYALMNAFRKKEALVGLDCHEVFEPFFGLVSSSIIVGDRRICTIGLDCLEAIIKGVSIGTLQANSNKILGLLIRVCSYRYENCDQKA